ncbi:YidC/Oxa1 family membrane protein insertase [Rodentibacter pneumotropicus]|uniref:Membrane protein insertase YidC n=1 Tax=Rodentibacter pneumotropicus TaxID=758 RepID=A0A448MMD0_9PAST|nr:YidC/Oxa1 family membrane protein insertase [Rodentibacter pneumotropicus]
MDSRRSLLVLALMFISFLVYQQWQMDKNPPPVAEQTTSITSDVPASSSSSTQIASDSAVKGRIITLENDVLRLKVDTLGGDVVSSELLKYDAELDSKTPFVLLKDSPEHIYIAQSGLIGKNGIDTKSGRAQYQIEGDHFKLAEGQDFLSVPLIFEKDGVTYQKVFVLKRGSYDLGVDYKINNQSGETIEVEPYGQLKHTLVESSGNVAMPTYTGGAYSSSETNYKNTVSLI